jgi:hypothetical protein
MRCEKVLGQLSLHIDEMLEENLATEISQHLRSCPDCAREFLRLSRLKDALKSLQPVSAPDYLGDLVNLKIRQAHQETWQKGLQSALEYRWSKIKTAGGMWYATRLMGALATVVFFIAICSAISPLYMTLATQIPTQVDWPRIESSSKLAQKVQQNFGMPIAQKMPIRLQEATINDEYLFNLSQSASLTERNDTVSVVTMVDRNGAAKVQDVLEYPADDSLLSGFTEMINSAGWRPASQNGRAVDSRQVRIFSTIYVHD